MVNAIPQIYEQFSSWIKLDVNRDRAITNRKILSVAVWCLILPIFLTLIAFLNRKFFQFNIDRYTDDIIFFPPLVYVLISLWPTLRDLPRVFKKGGFVALVEDSQREVEWREKTSLQMNADLRFGKNEWTLVSFHLKHELDRMRDQNKYMTILTGAVLFLMFQFLDLGGNSDMVRAVGAQAMVRGWVEQFAQWSYQFFSLLLFTALFYLSGTQYRRNLLRYLVCVDRIIAGLDS